MEEIIAHISETADIVKILKPLYNYQVGRINDKIRICEKKGYMYGYNKKINRGIYLSALAS